MMDTGEHGHGSPVLLHGFTGSGRTWGPRIVDGLAAAIGSPVLVDLPGHGRWAADPAARPAELDATLGYLDQLGGWPAPLIGYSMGGRIALHYAARSPDAVPALVLEAASPGLSEESERADRRRADEALAQSLERDGLDAFVRRWESLPLFESQGALAPAERARIRSGRLANDPCGLAAALRGLGTGALPSLWEALPEIEIPTLVVVGALDRKFVEIGKRMAAALPAADFVVVPGAGHCVHLERPDAWLAAVTDFLGRRVAPRR